jgi:glycosyltransferase involved in cell wall biosynthesis
MQKNRQLNTQHITWGESVAGGWNTALFERESRKIVVASAASKLSMVVCSYNQAPFIRETLESLVKQQDVRPGELEIIVIDGGSTDGSAEIIMEYAEHYAFVVSEPDGGQTQALKRGFSRAAGDVLGWLCSDDVLEPNTTRFVLDYFGQNPEVEFMYGDAHLIGRAGELLKTKREIPFNWFIWKYAYNYVPQSSAFWRRSLYEEVNGLDETFELCMDGDLWARFAERTRPRHVKRVLSKIRTYPQQKTHRLEAQSADEYKRVCRRYGTDLTNITTVRALRLLARFWRVSWKLMTGCYWRNYSGRHAAIK